MNRRPKFSVDGENVDYSIHKFGWHGVVGVGVGRQRFSQCDCVLFLVWVGPLQVQILLYI